jgi:BirA family biotin operon repressor/biotin-[acetyl-CoA-carboxylase] ligase
VPERTAALLHALADGRCHSGEDLAATLGITRAGVWKRVRALDRWGISVHAERGRGYRLSDPIEWLDAVAIERHIAGRCSIASLTVSFETDSTNQRLLEAPAPDPRSVRVCLAEFQTAGRGRRGRAWRAPLGSGLCLSVGACFETVPKDFPALGLAVGVVLRRVLERQGCQDVELKWPNDLVHRERKLGGILLEVQSEAHGPTQVVIGVGLNVCVSESVLASMCEWPLGATDLRSVAAEPPRRNLLAGEIVVALDALLRDYPNTGFAAYRDEWRRADHLAGRIVEVRSGPHAGSATALGIDDDGALALRSASGERVRLSSGEVSVQSAWT